MNECEPSTASVRKERVAAPSTVVLVSNKLYHYRVAIYNYLNGRLREHGYELVVITNALQADSPHEIGFRLIVEPFAFRRYKRILARLEPRVVILFMHIKDLVVWPLLVELRFRGVPVIYWNHGINLQTPNNRLKRFIFGVFHQAADAILLYSSNEKRYIARRHASKIHVANNTLNFASFPSIPQAKEAIRAELQIPFKKVVLFVGRITAEKRLDDLLGAAPLLVDGAGVVIVGGGLNSRQRDLIGRSGNVRYLGEIYETEAVNRIFKMADVFSIPGKIGLGINHAFYWGLPVVTENVRHSPEIIYLKDGQNGFMVERGDVRALAEKLNLLLSSAELYASFSEAARKEIELNASIDRMCDGFLQAIRFAERRTMP